ncbi:MAG: DUF5683 domain-containing protein [Candidatus Poribacteria bacterium]
MMHVIAWTHYKNKNNDSYTLFFILCVISFIFPFSIFASSDDILSIADNLANQGLCDSAITEYKRFIFFNPDNSQTAEAYYKMGLCYRLEGRMHDGIFALNKSVFLSDNSDLANKRRLTLATTLIASRNYNLAKLELAKIINSTNDELLLRKALYFYGIEAIYNRDWRSVQEYFSKFYQKEENINKIDTIIKTTEKSYKFPTKARIFSAIIPGSGQIYSGNWKSGLNALILNGVIIGGITYNIYKKDYANALMIAYLFLPRYYNGNIYHAGKDAEKYNQKLDDQTAKRLIELISIDEPY